MAVRFDADGEDYTRALSLGAVTQFSITAWAKISVDRNTYSTVWSLDNNTTSDFWLLQTNSNGTGLTAITEGTAVNSLTTLTVGTWYFIGVAVSGTTVTIKVRAEGAASFTTINHTVGSGSTTVTRLRLGESSFTAEWLNGCMAGVKIWTATLSALELEAEYPQFAPVRTADLFAYYEFVGPSTADDSGNGQTLSGGVGTTQEPGPDLAPLVTPIGVADAATGADTVTVAGNLPLSQTGSGVDVVTTTASVPLTQTGAAADALAAVVATTFAESASAAEAISAGQQKTLDQTATAVDVLAGQAAVPLGQAGTAADTATVAATLTLTQTGAAADALTASLTSFKALGDTAAAADDLAAILQRTVGPAHPPRRAWSAGQPTRYPAG